LIADTDRQKVFSRIYFPGYPTLKAFACESPSIMRTFDPIHFKFLNNEFGEESFERIIPE
tara:strand:- start:480 stop:659 length:180 start_codon:yes stop_codon:yes gene_type:complete